MVHAYSNVVEMISEHLHTHVYPEKEGDRGRNNLASLIMKTFGQLDVLGGHTWRKLTIFYNCAGQNKTKTVLLLVPYLIECS